MLAVSWMDEAPDRSVYPLAAMFGNPLNRDPPNKGKLRGYWTDGQLIGLDVAALFSSLHSLYC